MEYDVAIIGAGPAGMTAGIFARRGGLKTVCFEQMSVGGNATLATRVDNYPGLESISGIELSERMESQAKHLGVEFLYEQVRTLRIVDGKVLLETKHNSYTSTNVILACGCKTKTLGIEDEEKFVGRGVSYCASCDGNFYKGQAVAVVGSGNMAYEDAIYLSNLAKKVYLINKSSRFRFSSSRLGILKRKQNIEILYNSEIESIEGDEKLKSVTISSDIQKKKLDVEAVFVAIGREPNINFEGIELDLDANGYVKVKKDQSTNVKNLYACGDVTNSKLKQIITACASGSIAASACIRGRK